MENNQYKCPRCGSEMKVIFEKPALNLICPKCGFQIATTKWDEIDLDLTNYKIILSKNMNPTINQIKCISSLTGKNYIETIQMFNNSDVVFEGKAIDIISKKEDLKKNGVEFLILPEFPY